MYIYVHTYVSNTNFKEAGVYMSILDQRNCGLKNIIRDTPGHFIIIKVNSSKQPKDIWNRIFYKYQTRKKKKRTELKENKSIWSSFSILFLVIGGIIGLKSVKYRIFM